MDLIVKLKQYLIEDNITKINEIKSLCEQYIDAVKTRNGSVITCNVPRDIFATSFLTPQLKNEVLGHAEKSKYTVIAAK
jgi:hypothetical protein